MLSIWEYYYIEKRLSSMVGYYKINKKDIDILPKNSINVEEHLYDLVCPLVVSEKSDVLDELLLLYDMLDIPVVSAKDYSLNNVYSCDEYKIRQVQEFLKMNESIEMLEEGCLGHLLRVGKYAYELARELRLSDGECRDIYMAAILHDTGKYLIPDDIVSKKERLSGVEYRIMKKHTDYAWDILHNFLDDDVLDTVMSHHERVDGSGYPSGKSPELGARILGIADSFDAMISDRVYKKGKSVREALNELEKCSLSQDNGGYGELFDRDLVERFVDMKMRDGGLRE